MRESASSMSLIVRLDFSMCESASRRMDRVDPSPPSGSMSSAALRPMVSLTDDDLWRIHRDSLRRRGGVTSGGVE